ncbi:MAG: CsgG/HfaB family protein [Gemmatimonadaceae bacterium]
MTLTHARCRATIAVAALAVGLSACATRPLALAPVSPERASESLASARSNYASHPDSPGARLALGVALYDAASYAESRTMLQPLLDTPGDAGARANLYFAASADRTGDLEAARRGYTRFLAMGGESDEVRTRLGDVQRRDAQTTIRQALANERALNPMRFPEGSIGVAPFTVATADSSLAALGYGLADLLITDLARSSKLQVVDRVRLDELMRETKLTPGGSVDSASAARAGLLIGARRLVNGSVTQMPNEQLGIDARVTDVATARRIGSPVRSTTGFDELLDRVSTVALRLFEEMGIALTPAERAAVERKPTQSLKAFLAFSRGVRDEAQFDFGRAMRDYGDALRLDPGFDLARRHLLGVGGAASAAAANVRALGQSGLLDGVNPSPAGDLGLFADRGDRSARAAFEGSAFGNLIIVLIGSGLGGAR